MQSFGIDDIRRQGKHKQLRSFFKLGDTFFIGTEFKLEVETMLIEENIHFHTLPHSYNQLLISIQN